MNKSCQRCGSAFIQTRYGYSQGDQLGAMYEYEFCILCGSVKHVINHTEYLAQAHDLIETIGTHLSVTLAIHRA